IMRAVKPRVFVTAERFGRLEYQPDLCADVPIVGGVGRGFDDLLAPDPMPGTTPADPAAPALIAFTSGTTRDPKGVIHSHNTIGFEARQLDFFFPRGGPPQIIGAPVGHFIGMLNAFLVSLQRESAVHLLDVWD